MKNEVCPRNILFKRVKGVDAVISQWEDYIDKEFFELLILLLDATELI